MNSLPLNRRLSVTKLSSVFNNTVASYKFYWFISLLQLFTERNNKSIPIKDILIKMICNAWYPINFFKLSFGFSDKLNTNISIIRSILNIPIDISKEELFVKLQCTSDKQVNRLIIHFEQLVPYRFLSPWIKGTKNEIIQRSQFFENNCLYRFNNDGINSIEINPDWSTYLNENNKILIDYTYWNLNLFLQVRNPNIPDVAGKLIKPISRGSLIKQRNFWNIVLNEIETFNCIYTGKTLTVDNFDMEHFIPWSFVAHDQLWNLLPSNSSINSSKSNKLPLLDKYLEPFVDAQYQAINTVYRKQPQNKLLEDYLILGTNISDIVRTPLLDFKDKYYNTLSPLVQIANNSGFEFWER